MTFITRAQAVLRDYVRSVVVLDDHWPEPVSASPQLPALEELEPLPDEVDISEEPSTHGSSEATNAQHEPAAPDPAEPGDRGAPVSSGASPPEPQASTAEQQLLEIRDSVVAEGIVFTGLRYDPSDTGVTEAALKLAMRSDVLILDWNLAATDEGDVAISLLKEIEERGTGPRFVYIFTQQSNLDSVQERLRADFPSREEHQDGVYEAETFLFAVRRKHYEAGPAQSSSVRPSQLISDALAALSNARSGLMELAMIELTTRHRWHLNAMLDRFGDSLDLALLLEHVFSGAISLSGAGSAIHEVLFDEWRAQLAGPQRAKPLQILSEEGLADFFASIRDEVAEGIGDFEPYPEDVMADDAQCKAAVKRSRSLLKDAGLVAERTLGLPKPAVANLPQKILEAVASTEALTNPPQLAGSGKDPDMIRRRSAYWIIQGLTKSRQAEQDVDIAFLKVQRMLTQRRFLPSRVSQGTVLRVESGPKAGEFLVCTTPLCDAYSPAKIKHTFTFVRATEGSVATLAGLLLRCMPRGGTRCSVDGTAHRRREPSPSASVMSA